MTGLDMTASEARTCYLNGQELFHRHARRNYERAKEMFSKAIALDPLYAKAYAGIADVDAFLFIGYSMEGALDSVLLNSDKALALDPDLAEARATRGLALSGKRRYAEAEAEFERAIALNPDLYEAHYFYGRCCYVQGKLEETARHWQRASEVNPNDFQAAVLLTQVYFTLNQRDNELNAAQRGLERAEQELARNPDNARAAYLGANALSVMGKVEQAKEWSARAMAIDPDDAMTSYNIACQSVCFGEYDRAFDLLESLLPRVSRDTKVWTLQDSDFNELRDLPRWQKIVELARV